MYHSGNNQEEVTSKLSASADQGTKWHKSNLQQKAMGDKIRPFATRVGISEGI